MKPSEHLAGRKETIVALMTLVGLSAGSIGSEPAAGSAAGGGPAKVEVRQAAGRFQLYVNGIPFYVKGAGIELGSPEKLREHGGNSFRTWSADNGRASGKQVLDRALANGLYVAMGLDVDHERRGFNYDDTNAVARQQASLLAQVREYKDHPALLLWVIGNELNLEQNPKVWDAVNGLSQAIHRIDPNHLTTTTLAGFKPETVALVRSRAPDLDFLSFQMYCDIINLPRYLASAGWDKPYLVTEWGATGHWEVGRTAWGAPLENDSTAKADLYQFRMEKAILSDQRLCLGSYVFLWGDKQERTPTWYGMFLKTGEETAPVDVMHYFWTGAWPTNRSPRLEGIWLDEKPASRNIHLLAGRNYAARVRASAPDGDALAFSWEVMPESTEKKVGGDAESVPLPLPGRLVPPDRSEVTLRAPDRAGAYRLFAYVYDGHGHAAHANIPFYVDAPGEDLSTAVSHSRPPQTQR